MANLYAHCKTADLVGLQQRIYIKSCGFDEEASVHDVRRPEGRDDYHLVFMTEGVGHFVRNGFEFDVQPGECVLFYPNEPYEYRFDGQEKLGRYWLHFKGDQADEIVREFGLENCNVVEISEPVQVEVIFDKIIHEIWLQEPGYLKCSGGLLFWLLTLISRDVARPDHAGLTRYDAIKRVIYHIHSNYAENTDVQTLADLCHLSKYRFIVNFKKMTGYTPIDYRNKIRVDQARRLLTETEQPMYVIAEQLGFQSATYFSTVFKKFTGLSPREFMANRAAHLAKNRG